MDGGASLHSHAHQSPGDRNEEVGSSSTRAEPTDSEIHDTQADTDPKYNPHKHKKENSEARLGPLTPAQRRRAIIGDEEGGPSSQPEASIKQIARASSPTSITPDELHENDGDDKNTPVHPRLPLTTPHATAAATHEPVSRDKARKRARGSHGPVYQSYQEYGNHGPQNETSKFGIPLISLIPDTQPVDRNGVTSHGGQPYQHDWDGAHEREAYPYPEEIHTPAFMENQAWANSKLILHVFAILLSISSLGLILSLIPNRDVISSSVMFSFPVPAIAIGWGFIEVMAFIFILKCRPGPGILNGILPLGQLGLSLVLALACVVVAYLQWTSISAIDRRCSRTPSTTLVYNNWQDLCQSQWPEKKPSAMAIAIINIITAVVYVVLFVAACIDTIYGKEEEE
ncbi:unnamed protein product [Clonostachys solani]|uniref:MARVEL domain-containing protein n=1 Tax=Clonostachys solani TaxID=160281 RepID=A0A9P0ESU3_9HYPO|nr:unnamed protein product [Clonostachys solani]